MKSKAAANNTYKKLAVQWFLKKFVVNQTLVLRMKFSTKNPALLVAATRWWKKLKMKVFRIE